MIVAVIKESLNNCDFEIIFRLKAKYDFTLGLICPYIVDSMIDSLTKEPYYMELKLHLIDDFMPSITSANAFKLVDKFSELLQ